MGMITKEILSNQLFFTNVRQIIDSGNPVELKVKGMSMYPTLLDGKHKVVLIPYHRQHLRIGVIALFVYNKKYILHRLVSIEGDRLIFQGDNLSRVRECVTENDIVAIVEYIITPTGKLIDCKKCWFFLKDKRWRSVQRYYLKVAEKLKGFLLGANR